MEDLLKDVDFSGMISKGLDIMSDISHYQKMKVRISKNRFKWRYIYIEGLDLYKYYPLMLPVIRSSLRVLKKNLK